MRKLAFIVLIAMGLGSCDLAGFEVHKTKSVKFMGQQDTTHTCESDTAHFAH